MTPIDAIISLEWSAFDKVNNAGGRANCQDDFATFELMRKSQFLSWDKATRESYLDDLQRAKKAGRNLIQEKYARMMISTAPQEYATFEHTLPPLSAWQLSTIEAIITQQLEWREAFARVYPRMSSQARLIRTAEDSPSGTSFETYLRGELGTYSEATLQAYQKMIDDYVQRGENITTAAMQHTALLYGYESLAAAEQKLQ
ncbi:DUF4125 family protein [Uliginosibacterium flavum]|uniref:DUF4125 family protein n=1 Tax=Uliginosibacterium flavum TaxID=1396831 RepID=A0ABV2TG37_9RHOO